jgi:hypothetical protein
MEIIYYIGEEKNIEKIIFICKNYDYLMRALDRAKIILDANRIEEKDSIDTLLNRLRKDGSLGFI